MKKVLLFALALVAGVSMASAQGFSWGIKGGANLTSLTAMDNSCYKFSAFGGAFAEYRFNDRWAISPELLYSRQGCNFDDILLVMGNGDSYTLTDRVMRLNYLNVPVLAKFYVCKHLSIDLGPQVGFLLNATNKSTLDGSESIVTGTEGYHTVDLSVGLGVTYNYKSFLVSGRYNQGLTNVIKEDAGNTKHSVFQLGVGYRF